MATTRTVETITFSKWDRTAQHTLKGFAARKDIQIVDIRREKEDLVVVFKRTVPGLTKANK
ncbi:hypothetical protein [Alicyclobacillus ferrooxydans]|uniref:Uncharacterized protein n=1 Tax=Alicyclobacillus ferrooxydans TaxID=471514 RepID=A0A0P9CE21_9BACL|nr:hypothetical protein [Alicyclobacillus ferrooxydans]KPV44060.1 hypothetical protein AN477_09220 [Alicyclobacillus ferrooxydans]